MEHHHDEFGERSELHTTACEGCGFVHAPDTPCPDGTEWQRGTVECRLCGCTHVAVWPTSILDDTRLECTDCGHMACEPVDE